ncbi:NAD(P)-dependent oxidoreductase [Jonesia denitrificans]
MAVSFTHLAGTDLWYHSALAALRFDDQDTHRCGTSSQGKPPFHSGALGGAAVDVTDREPLPDSSPLWDAPNLILTPHALVSLGHVGSLHDQCCPYSSPDDSAFDSARAH